MNNYNKNDLTNFTTYQHNNISLYHYINNIMKQPSKGNQPNTIRHHNIKYKITKTLKFNIINIIGVTPVSLMNDASYITISQYFH
jgi:hypothetical protein